MSPDSTIGERAAFVGTCDIDAYPESVAAPGGPILVVMPSEVDICGRENGAVDLNPTYPQVSLDQAGRGPKVE